MKRKVLLKFFCIFILFFLNLEILASSSTYRVNKNMLLYCLEKINYYNNLSTLKYFNKYNASEITPKERYFYHIIYSLDKAKATLEDKRFDAVNSLLDIIPIHPIISSGLMNSSWPMYCHDIRHTGHSPYSTINVWDEIWHYKITRVAEGDVVVDNNGTIYFGANGLYAMNPNGTLKWKFITDFLVEGAPAIDENGIIYFGTVCGTPSFLFALYPDGTLKWAYSATSIFSSPVISNDGSIIFADADNWNIISLYPNGTQKWGYHTNMVVYSSPAIGPDGTVYCGSHDCCLYALYPNNGTLKWRFGTGHWIRVSPCIADDGTIYCVSLDNHLYAINPDGTLKWKTNMGQAGTSPTIGQDGTIYCGYETLFAVNPTNGSVIWTFPVGGTMCGGTPCNSIDGTIYVGTSDGGELIAINPDGTLKWRKSIGTCESAPAIGEDGVVYIGSSYGSLEGYFYAFGYAELKAKANGPYYGLINEPVQFKGSSSGGYLPYSYHWIFGDGQTSDDQNPLHIYTSAGSYNVTLTVTDNTSNTSSDTTWAWIQTTNTAPSIPIINGSTKCVPGKSYNYSFLSADPDGTPIWYYIDWGDGTNTGWIGQYTSGEQIINSNSWSWKSTFTILCKAKDPYNGESDWGTLHVNVPRNKIADNMFFYRFLERIPILQKMFNFLSIYN